MVRFVDPRCTCSPGHRCRICTERQRAHWRMVGLARLEQRTADPVAWADQRTSMNDARTALCLTMGVALKHIHPASGHSKGATK